MCGTFLRLTVPNSGQYKVPFVLFVHSVNVLRVARDLFYKKSCHSTLRKVVQLRHQREMTEGKDYNVHSFRVSRLCTT